MSLFSEDCSSPASELDQTIKSLFWTYYKMWIRSRGRITGFWQHIKCKTVWHQSSVSSLPHVFDKETVPPEALLCPRAMQPDSTVTGTQSNCAGAILTPSQDSDGRASTILKQKSSVFLGVWSKRHSANVAFCKASVKCHLTLHTPWMFCNSKMTIVLFS